MVKDLDLSDGQFIHHQKQVFGSGLLDLEDKVQYLNKLIKNRR